MKKDALRGAEKYTKEHQRKKRWYRVVTCLACVVVFCTVYALILPAITLEKGACEIPEHTHSEACYTQVTSTRTEPVCTIESLNLHQHDDTCYDSEGNLTCGYADYVVHHHDSSCYDEDGNLWCPLPEIETHEHTDSCYSVPETDASAEVHTHTDDCYTMERGELICTEPAHEHTDDCYEWKKVLTCDLSTEPAESTLEESTEPVLICEKPEVILHTHQPYESPENPGCYDEDGNLVCGQIQVLEHQHTEDCFTTVEEPVDADTLTCTNTDENHTHTALCYGRWELTCGMEEHTHTEDCGGDSEAVEETQETQEALEQTFYCGKTSHVHTEDCGGEGVCPLEEHIHTDNCKIPPEEEALAELSFEGPDYTVTVQYGADAALPEGVELVVAEIPQDSDEYRTYCVQASAAMETKELAHTVRFARFFDISFRLDGVIYEPAAPVSVTITYADEVETGEDTDCQAIHFTDDGTEVLNVTANQQDDGSTSFTHTQESFSVVGDVVTFSVTGNSVDNGRVSLPVDYYVCIDGEWVCVGSTKTGWYGNHKDGEPWSNDNRDYITVAQALSILEPYGFTGDELNPSLVTAYQQKSGNTNIYSDTTTVEKDDKKILPLSINEDHAGYNLYYLPNNMKKIIGVASPESLDKSANGFYTVKVFDVLGKKLKSQVVRTGGDFEYDATETNVPAWLADRGGTSVEKISGNRIQINNITTPVTVSPAPDGESGNHSVTFKVMIDEQWKTVGSLPYYYSGSVNGSQRAYITSAMAAQMFGDYGYTATTDPGYQFGYSYNDIYKIYYAGNTGYCMDVKGNNIANNTAVQLWTSNESTAQKFRIWDSGDDYSYITPVEDSSYHVNVGGGGTNDGTKLIIHTAIDEASHWKVVSNGDGTTSFYNKKAPETAVIDLPGGNVAEGNQLHIWNDGGYRYWKLVQQYQVSNDTVSKQNSDGTWKIGLTPESNGDIVCYYMPAETASVYNNVSESEVNTNNSFWSVSVRDDTHSVYTEGELSGMVQTVKNGGTANVTVRNAAGILWSCRGVNGQTLDVKSTQSEGNTTFEIENITQPVEIMATKADPSFTVQYYANIPRFDTSGDNPLKVIDTSGKVLPTNGGTMATRNIYLESIGQNTTQNNGDATPLYRAKTTVKLTKLYTEKQCKFESEPGLEYFNKLKDNEDYELKKIWVLKDGKSADSTNANDWNVYSYNAEKTAFTNEAGQAVDGKILICDGAVIRLVFDSSSGDYHNGTTFYDYNISSGKNNDGRWRTGITGINSESNYGTSLNGKRNWRSGADIFAFGNDNCGTGMSGYLFDGSTLNKYSQKNSGYGGATFNLASGLNSDGTIRYNDWVVAPKLFNDGDATGKQTYSGSSLTFDRVGDTYTLSAATLKNSNGQSNTLSGLQYFFNPSPTNGTTHKHIFTNNFWPMDPAAGRTDALWGEYGNPGRFQGFTKTNNYKWGDLPADFPVSDDGNAHNWFFGMNFALSFSLTADYEGPLEYYFFGDDDLWVFLDDKLVCDIGGVHSSIGEYVNLRDYLPVGTSGQHTLSFFYTERGASGSTCYMSFTLPSVSSATTSRDTGSLKITKSLDGIGDAGDADFSGEEYEFKVDLRTSLNGSALNQTFSYSRNTSGGETYGTVKSGGTIKLHPNETVTISGIPAGTFYQVTETEESRKGYSTTANNKEGYIVSGKIESGEMAPASFVNRPYAELPETGGPGTEPYTLGGLLLVTAAAMLLLYNHIKRRKEGSASS